MFKMHFCSCVFWLTLIVSYHCSLISQLVPWCLASCLLRASNSRDSKDTKIKLLLCVVHREFCFKREWEMYGFAIALISVRGRLHTYVTVPAIFAVFKVAFLLSTVLKYIFAM